MKTINKCLMITVNRKAAILSLFCVICLNCCIAAAQELKLKIPAASSGQKIEQEFALGTISVNYYRPNTKGRKIFGGIEPYGTVWRTGANNATVVTVTDTVSIEGHLLAPGAYSLFSIPGVKEWTIIFNKSADQWGAYSYDQKQDVLRFKIKPLQLATKVETMTIQFADVQQDDCLLQIMWENTGLNIHLKSVVDNRIMANIQDAMKGDKKPYYMSAIWYYNHGRDVKQALAWMQEEDKTQTNAFNVKYWLARFQLKLGDKKAAIASANEGLRLATEQKNQEYIRMNKEVLRDAGLK